MTRKRITGAWNEWEKLRKCCAVPRRAGSVLGPGRSYGSESLWHEPIQDQKLSPDHQGSNLKLSKIRLKN